MGTEIGNKKAREKTSQALREKAPELMEMLQKDFESHKHQNALMNSYNGVRNSIGDSTMNTALTGMNGGNNVMFGNNCGSNNGGHVVNGLNMTMQLPKQHNLTPQISEETLNTALAALTAATKKAQLDSSNIRRDNLKNPSSR